MQNNCPYGGAMGQGLSEPEALLPEDPPPPEPISVSSDNTRPRALHPRTEHYWSIPFASAGRAALDRMLLASP